jgi:MtN3 and saliva related transmembrane protein
MIEATTAIGFVAGALTSLSAAPQVWRLWKSRSGDNVSYRMFISLSAGLALWVVYGVLLDQIALIVANSVSLILNLAVLFMKWKFRHNHTDSSTSEKSTVDENSKHQ